MRAYGKIQGRAHAHTHSTPLNAFQWNLFARLCARWPLKASLPSNPLRLVPSWLGDYFKLYFQAESLLIAPGKFTSSLRFGASREHKWGSAELTGLLLFLLSSRRQPRCRGQPSETITAAICEEAPGRRCHPSAWDGCCVLVPFSVWAFFFPPSWCHTRLLSTSKVRKGFILDKNVRRCSLVGKCIKIPSSLLCFILFLAKQKLWEPWEIFSPLFALSLLMSDREFKMDGWWMDGAPVTCCCH